MELQAIDLTTLQRKGISKEQLEEELKMLKEGFPFLKIYSAGWKSCQDGAVKWCCKSHVQRLVLVC